MGKRDKSASGHSVTVRETVAVTSAEFNGATAFEVSGEILFQWLFEAFPLSSILDLLISNHTLASSYYYL